TYKEKDSYPPISKDKKIYFLRTTVIEELKEAEVTISQHKFEFVDCRTIVDRFDNNKQLIDIIGKIVGVGPQENVHVQGSTIPMRNIDIMNPEKMPSHALQQLKILKKTLDDTISDAQSATKKYRIQLNVDDGIERAVFILFDKEAKKLLHTIARELSNKYATMNANSTLPNEIEKLIGKTFVFQLKLNDYNWKEGWELYTIEKVFDNISNDETEMELDHITTEALENYEVKKNANQTSQKNKFEVLDKKPLTSTNNDEKRSKQEHNNGAIPSINSASNVEDTEPSDDNMFLRDLINCQKATKHKSSKKKKLQ
ncbi:hypothetical protein SO802_008498, partial [Lithocarpus litseifolius]